MNFESVSSEWNKFLEIKWNTAKAFQEARNCKVCLCLELLKLVSCPDDCHSEDWTEVFSRLLDGIIDSETSQSVHNHLTGHTDNIQLMYHTQNEVQSLKQSLVSSNEALSKYSHIATQYEALKQSLKGSENQPPNSPNLMKKATLLESRISQYEESLNTLKQENSSLTQQLQQASQLYEGYLATAKQTEQTLKQQFHLIKEEQSRLKSLVDTISQQVQSTSEALASLRTQKSSKVEIEATINELRSKKAEWLLEQEQVLLSLRSQVDQLRLKQGETDIKIDKSNANLHKLKSDMTELTKKQELCLDTSRHTSHLLSAADAVCVAHHEFTELQTVISERLQEVQNSLDSQPSSKLSAYQQEVYALRKQSEELQKASLVEELKHGKAAEVRFHPGNLVIQFGVSCYSCCKGSPDSMGCAKKSL